MGEDQGRAEIDAGDGAGGIFAAVDVEAQPGVAAAPVDADHAMLVHYGEVALDLAFAAADTVGQGSIGDPQDRQLIPAAARQQPQKNSSVSTAARPRGLRRAVAWRMAQAFSTLGMAVVKPR